jgi:glycosyltransferase involved in cell wall biosynthesis
VDAGGGVTYLAVVAIVKDEAAHIREWVAFHQVVGVERFIIYDNESTDGTRELLEQLDDVEVRPWPGVARQMPAYRDALERGDARWLAFIDADEFLFSPTYEPLSAVLSRFERHPAVGVGWLVFGTSGHQEPQDSTLTAYTRRAGDDEWQNTHIKSIVQPDRVTPHRPGCPHCFNCPTVDEQHRTISGPFNSDPSWGLLRIHHYWKRSEVEWADKLTRLRADNGAIHPLFDIPDNAVEDTTIVPYAEPTLARMSEWTATTHITASATVSGAPR